MYLCKVTGSYKPRVTDNWQKEREAGVWQIPVQSSVSQRIPLTSPGGAFSAWPWRGGVETRPGGQGWTGLLLPGLESALWGGRRATSLKLPPKIVEGVSSEWRQCCHLMTNKYITGSNRNMTEEISCKKVSKVKFLYSAVSSPQDRSNPFTLYFPDRPVHSDTISASLGSIQPYATINARRLLVCISTTVYSQVLIYSAEWTGAM